MKLTKKEHRALCAIHLHILRNNYPPSLREISKLIGVVSSSTAYGYVMRLKRKGYVDWEPTQPRTLRVLKNYVS